MFEDKIKIFDNKFFEVLSDGDCVIIHSKYHEMFFYLPANLKDEFASQLIECCLYILEKNE